MRAIVGKRRLRRVESRLVHQPSSIHRDHVDPDELRTAANYA
jgi:hypothetical protein